MNFRTNQVLQFYVNNDKNTVALVDKTADKGIFWFTNTQNGKVVSRTDVVEKDKILYATYATAASMQIPTKKFTVAAPAEVVAGQDYVVKVEFTNYQGMGDMDMTVKVGAAHATANTDAKKLMDEIAWTLEKNLKSEYAPLVTVTVDGSNNLVIEEVLQDEWILGVTPNEGVNFRVYVAPIVVDGEEIFDWTTITKDNGKIRVLKSRNIGNNEIVNIPDYDCYIDSIEGLDVAKYLNQANCVLLPNLTYNPRACFLPKGCIADGSVAILTLAKDDDIVTNEDLAFYATDSFTKFYAIARNLGTRSLNIDNNSVFFFGKLKQQRI